jgi:glycine/D-amino acid oxidase-like deaminating enzyme
MRLSYPPAPSYYALDDAWETRAPLRGEISADVAVLGGGIAGCSAALHLAKRGYKVALLEARRVGYGASGRAGGQTIFGFAVGQQRLEREVGRDDARRLFDLSVEALDLTQSLIQEYAIDCDYCPETAGAVLYENSEVLRYENGREVRVHTAQGTVRCAHLVLCGNAYIGAVAPSLARRILGVGTYIIATEPLGEERARSLLPSNAAVADINWILDYFRRSQDHRMLFGGRVSYSSVQPPRLPESMRKRMVRVFPSLSDVKVANAWGGYLDITMSRAPDFGRLAPNVYYLQGFSGHGVALAGLAGALASEAIAGTAERFDVFARIPHRDFPGGRLLRRPSLMLAMLYYRLRDML